MEHVSHTPHFDAALADYYSTEHSRIRTCPETGEVFELTEDMYEMYKRLGVPLPKNAPAARLRRLRAYMGGIELFRKKNSDGYDLISMYDPESPVDIVSPEFWFSDEFDALKYGTKFLSHESFFSQWHTFYPRVPRQSIITDPESENCTWCLYDLAFKDCYATFGGVSCNRIMYGDMCISSEHSIDVANMTQSEWSYACVSCFQCSHAYYSAFCGSSFNISFCFDSRNISDCFGCVNITNKKYCFFNKQLTKEEYMKRVAQLDLSDRAVVDVVMQKVIKLWHTSFRESNANVNSERVIGDELVDCKDTVGISGFALERVYNTFDASFLTDCADVTTCSKLEKSVSSVVCTDGYENKMSISCHGCIDVEYSEHCISSEHLFGCIGLKYKKYCIFNVQYSEEDYWKKVDEIKTAMLARGEYGEFFPYSSSLFAYNTSHAVAFFPLSQSEVLHLGGRWYAFPQKTPSLERLQKQVPEKLDTVDDSILEQQFTCPTSGRVFRIVKPELSFHKKMNSALPFEHPSVRRKRNYTHMGDLTLYHRSCEECHTKLYTRFPKSLPQKIVCSECFNTILLEDRMMK